MVGLQPFPLDLGLTGTVFIIGGCWGAVQDFIGTVFSVELAQNKIFFTP